MGRKRKITDKMIDEVRSALVADNGRVARAIKLCREYGVPSEIFGELLKEGLSTVYGQGFNTILLYGAPIERYSTVSASQAEIDAHMSMYKNVPPLM